MLARPRVCIPNATAWAWARAICFFTHLFAFLPSSSISFSSRSEKLHFIAFFAFFAFSAASFCAAAFSAASAESKSPAPYMDFLTASCASKRPTCAHSLLVYLQTNAIACHLLHHCPRQYVIWVVVSWQAFARLLLCRHYCPP